MQEIRNILAVVLVLGGLFFFYVYIAPLIVDTEDYQSYDTEDVREKIEDYLYDKYGEEFVVDRIGLRSSRGDYFYQARIYPEAIIGTNKQGDDYYYASASVDRKSNTELGGVGDSYSYVVRNIDVEEYLLAETKEIFGERVLLKVDVAHQITGDGSWWAGFKSKSLEEMREAIENDPEGNRIMLDLDVYVFERIVDDEEKEERREDIFEFVQYLQEEGLFEHLEMRVVFVDERVLADSYDEFDRKIFLADKEEVYIEEEDKTLELPPEELREEMSKKLQAEIDGMSEEELLANMNEIRKDELSHNEIGRWSGQYLARIYSPGMIKERYTSTYDRDPDIVRDFKKIDDVGLGYIFNYIYIN